MRNNTLIFSLIGKMFTGLIEFILETRVDGSRLLLVDLNQELIQEIKIGDSICVNGVCLTATQIDTDKRTVEFFVMSETFSKVVFRSRSNVELSLKAESRIHGHYLTGHIDRTVRIDSIKENPDGSHEIWLEHNGIIPKYKDSIGLEGISLTVAEVNSTSFRVSITPHTWKKTTIQDWVPGELINLEENKSLHELTDQDYMKLALQEAEKGRWTTAPNPWVGCLIVKDKKILGVGYHVQAGSPHAEVNAARDESNLEGSTFYVTLEPCSHHGRTPPCTDLLLKVKPKRVVIGILDPDPRVNGRGAQILRDAGIEVVIGVLQKEIEYSLRSYLYHRRTGLPYCIAKIGLSLDGCYALATGARYWFTNKQSREYAHKLRAESQAIIVGRRTHELDKPELTVRLPNLPKEHKQPKKVVLRRTDDIEQTLIQLGKEGVLQCLIEGGGILQNQFFQRNLIQELYLQESSQVLRSPGVKWHDMVDLGHLNLELIETAQFNGDSMRHYYVRSRFPKMEKVIQSIRNGLPIIIMDDEKRENEGDLFVAAQFMTPELCNLFIKNGSGIICTPLPKVRAMQLDLEPMVEVNEDNNRTNFTVSCDLKGVKTGVSSVERSETIRALASEGAEKFTRPGHVFPLIAEYGGLKLREGHTEASLVLCSLAGLNEVGAIVELMKENGEMMRLVDCQEFAQKQKLELVTIPEIKEYLNSIRSRGNLVSSWCQLKTEYGVWDLFCYGENLILIKGKIHREEAVLVRVHSECYTGDILYSKHCDCGGQLAVSMEFINERGVGMIILPAKHEGRGIGLINKILAYRLQQKEGIDTYQANVRLGFGEDERNYSVVREILDHFGIKRIDLLTSDLGKIEALHEYVREVIPVVCDSIPENEAYLETKRNRL